MPTHVVTHSGSFHADDVLAFALIRVFFDAAASVERTRDAERIAAGDIVIDVGGEFDVVRRRFDHHQKSYEGTRSSAGMVLDWLEADGHVAPALAARLREVWVDYVDAVDNGQRTPDFGTPCFSTLAGMMGEAEYGATEDVRGFDALYLEAATFAATALRGVATGHRRAVAAREAVQAAMDEAVQTGRAVIELPEYIKWKPAYFELGGATHPTDYVMFPGERDYRVIAVPVELGSFDEKRSFPESWAGLEDDALSAVTGVPGAIFCHKNRFIAVFRDRETAWETMSRWGLTHRPAACGGKDA